MMRRVRREDEAAGLSAPRMSALSCVAFGTPRTLGELAAMEQVAPPTMTRLVAALEGGGYVVRRTDKRDRRIAWIHATAKGRRTIEAGRARRVAFLADQLRSLGLDDHAALERAAAILHEIYERSR
jgi:DNA-binding MarR family transcriptional regulator